MDKRKFRRRRAMKVATLFHETNGTSYDCRIADINSRGARIGFEKTELIGKRVELLILPEGVKVHGRVAWKAERSFGVRFDRALSWLEKHDVEAVSA